MVVEERVGVEKRVVVKERGGVEEIFWAEERVGCRGASGGRGVSQFISGSESSGESGGR